MSRIINADDITVKRKLKLHPDATIEGAPDLTDITATADEINTLDGFTGDVDDFNKLAAVDASAAEINALDGAPFGVDFTLNTQADDTRNVEIQLQDADGVDVTAAMAVLVYLADDAAGITGLTAAPDGGVAEGTAGVIIPVVANEAFWVITNATGLADIDITESGATSFYVVVVLPNGTLSVSAELAFTT